MIGTDINAKNGMRDSDKYKDVLRPNGISARNEKGKSLLSIYAQRKLKVENTSFTNELYATYHCNRYEIPIMHDVIITSRGLHKQARNCKVTEDGAEAITKKSR